MKIGRNHKCPCLSGKKYKHCHMGKPFIFERDATVNARNIALINAASDIFGFSAGKNWEDLKRNISGEQIRTFYEVQARLTRPELDWSSVMPAPISGLRGLYLGDIGPEVALKNLIRFSLYSDQIFVINPAHNPWILKGQYNPIENPDQFKADSLKLLRFLFQVSPWVASGMVQLIPDPGDFNLALRNETLRLAKERTKDEILNRSDLEVARAEGHDDMKRFLLSLPDDKLLAQIEKMQGKLSLEEREEFLAYARYELENDPLAVNQPLMGSESGQLNVLRGGTNLETALLISESTGAFLYTNQAGRWQEIVSSREEMSETARLWSPFAKAFQSLEFKFLENVDVGFANQLREDGRLESFRALLRKVGKDAAEVSSLSSLDMYVRDCSDELKGEYQKAQAEWGKIQESFLKWAGRGAVVATATAMATGHLIPNVASLTAGVLNTMVQLALRHTQQKQFRQTNPMSVFVDLSNKTQQGAITLI